MPTVNPTQHPVPEKAKTRRHSRISSIWIIPVVAAAIGAWMLISGFRHRDALVTISFDSAQGIAANRTKIKARSVDIGTVESIQLSDDFSHVNVVARIDHNATNLLREEARFWVVRPQIGASGITGVSTLISGVYIEMEPGEGIPGRRDFVGLETPPVSAYGEGGLSLKLTSDSVGGVQPADPILFRGRSVGKVISASFEPETGKFAYEIRINEPFDQTVNSNTRFWKTSAISLEAGVEGISLSAESIESIIAGGISFDLPKNAGPGPKVENGAAFHLYSRRDEINEYPYDHYVEYILLFSDSVRGLIPDAPVEYRGIRIGRVVDVSFDYLQEEAIIGSGEIPVPALVRIYPGYLDMGDSPESVIALQEIIEKRVSNGLRGELRLASLLTHSLYVSLDYFSDHDDGIISQIGEYKTLPTQASGIEMLEHKISDILDKIDSLPFEETIEDIRKTSQTASETLNTLAESADSLKRILDMEATRELPLSLTETLDQTRKTMSGLSKESPLYQSIDDVVHDLEEALNEFKRLVKDIDNKPSSLLFSRPAKPDPIPRGAREQ